MQYLDNQLVRKAIWIATKAHEKQRRWQDVPFIIHPFRVAMIAASDDDSPVTFATALLHDVLEDTDFKLLEIPADVRLFVECLTEKKEIKDNKERRLASLEKLNFVTSNVPTRVKIADRLDNLRDAALSSDAKSFGFYKESTEALLAISEKRGMLNEYGHEELWCLLHGFINAGLHSRFFAEEQAKFMVKATKGSHYDPMLYPGPPVDGATF